MTASTTTSTNQDSYSLRVTLFAIRNSYPKVRQLQTEDLQYWMNEEKFKNSLVILDVREIDEYKVSHLPSAISIKPDEPIDQVIAKSFEKFSGNTYELQCDGCVNIVAYCSLGYRSSSMAQKIYYELKRLKEAGNILPTTHVYNLEGSIFKWANEGKMLVDGENQETKYCHPYNVVWGKLLDYNLRKYSDTENTGQVAST